jgi:hypothetical protein
MERLKHSYLRAEFKQTALPFVDMASADFWQVQCNAQQFAFEKRMKLLRTQI